MMMDWYDSHVFSCVELSRWRRKCVDFIIVVLRNGDDLFFTSRTCTCEMSSDPNSEIRQCGIVGRISKATFEILFFLNDPKFPISMREMTISTRSWTLSHPGIRVGIVCLLLYHLLSITFTLRPRYGQSRWRYSH
jgi:hypothetical protein